MLATNPASRSQNHQTFNFRKMVGKKNGRSIRPIWASHFNLSGFEPKLIKLEFIIYLPKLKVNSSLKIGLK